MKKIAFFLLLATLPLLTSSCRERSQLPGPVMNEPAPDFTLVDTKGRTWTLSELKGKVVFINFWATWCQPCRDEMGSMQVAHNELPGDKFQMLTILFNDVPALADNFAKKFNLTFPILADPGGSTDQAYGLTGVPETFIVDKQGILREKFLGAVKWDSPKSWRMLLGYINQEKQ